MSDPQDSMAEIVNGLSVAHDAADKAGWTGTLAQCIEYLDEDNKRLRQLFELIRYEAKNPPDKDRQNRILNYANRALEIKA